MYASRMTRKLYSVGNFFFASPEAGTQVYSTSADMYSFGALTFITILNASGLHTELNNTKSSVTTTRNDQCDIRHLIHGSTTCILYKRKRYYLYQ